MWKRKGIFEVDFNNPVYLIPNPFHSTYQKIDLNLFNLHGCTLEIKREDKIHPYVSGNKFRKLKYNLRYAQENNYQQILTFGGAYSNHIAAVAAAGKAFDLKTVGVIRGEELASKVKENHTLAYAQKCGMHLHFVSRAAYAQKKDAYFLKQLTDQFGVSYILPEGGTNTLAVKGCAEILTQADMHYDYIAAPVGTGGTLAGLLVAATEKQKIIGYSALKVTFQISEIQKYTQKTNVELIDDYCFGGYAKLDTTLVEFINTFKQKTNIPLDPVYTGKMIFGIFDGIQEGYFKENSRILAIHTGGLQGIVGMNQRLKKKNLPQIEEDTIS